MRLGRDVEPVDNVGRAHSDVGAASFAHSNNPLRNLKARLILAAHSISTKPGWNPVRLHIDDEQLAKLILEAAKIERITPEARSGFFEEVLGTLRKDAARPALVTLYISGLQAICDPEALSTWHIRSDEFLLHKLAASKLGVKDRVLIHKLDDVSYCLGVVVEERIEPYVPYNQGPLYHCVHSSFRSVVFTENRNPKIVYDIQHYQFDRDLDALKNTRPGTWKWLYDVLSDKVGQENDLVDLHAVSRFRQYSISAQLLQNGWNPIAAEGNDEGFEDLFAAVNSLAKDSGDLRPYTMPGAIFLAMQKELFTLSRKDPGFIFTYRQILRVLTLPTEQFLTFCRHEHDRELYDRGPQAEIRLLFGPLDSPESQVRIFGQLRGGNGRPHPYPFGVRLSKDQGSVEFERYDPEKLATPGTLGWMASKLNQKLTLARDEYRDQFDERRELLEKFRDICPVQIRSEPAKAPWLDVANQRDISLRDSIQMHMTSMPSLVFADEDRFNAYAENALMTLAKNVKSREALIYMIDRMKIFSGCIDALLDPVEKRVFAVYGQDIAAAMKDVKDPQRESALMRLATDNVLSELIQQAKAEIARLRSEAKISVLESTEISEEDYPFVEEKVCQEDYARTARMEFLAVLPEHIRNARG